MRLPPAVRWGVAAELLPLVGGQRNIAFRTVGQDRDLVFKSSRRSVAALDWLGPVQATARQSGFVVPGLIPDLEGAIIADGWCCEVFVTGRPITAAEMAALTPMVARFYRLAAAIPQRPGFCSAVDLLDQVAGGDVDLARMPPDLVSRCRAAWRAVADRRETIVHDDLNPGNVIICPDGRPALIDWDECRRDVALFDLGPLQGSEDAEGIARLAWEVACSWQVEPDHARRLAAGL